MPMLSDILLFRQSATVPAQPTGASATALSSSSIKVDWTDNASDENGYRVERSPNGTDTWTNVSGSLAADVETYTDTGLTAGTTYYYRVYAFNGSGDSDPSSTVAAVATSFESFTADGTWDWEAAGSPETVDVLIVGGGGGGGGVTSNRAGGGGGAGRVRWVTGVAVAANVSVTVGAGGTGGTGGASGTNGGDGGTSSFGAEAAAGGGGGGFTASNGSNGASGGGAGTSGSTASTGGTGTGGFDGGDNAVAGGPGGGGGAGAVGADGSGSAAGNGGVGVDQSANVGTSVGDSGWFGGGGGGGGNTETAGTGGTGGGADGGFAGAGNAATANTGGGGGGAAINAEAGGAGGSGIVIVQWITPESSTGNRIGGTGAIRRPPRIPPRR